MYHYIEHTTHPLLSNSSRWCLILVLSDREKELRHLMARESLYLFVCHVSRFLVGNLPKPFYSSWVDLKEHKSLGNLDLIWGFLEQLRFSRINVSQLNGRNWQKITSTSNLLRATLLDLLNTYLMMSPVIAMSRSSVWIPITIEGSSLSPYVILVGFVLVKTSVLFRPTRTAHKSSWSMSCRCKLVIRNKALASFDCLLCLVCLFDD